MLPSVFAVWLMLLFDDVYTFFVAFISAYPKTVVLCTHHFNYQNLFIYLFLYLVKSYHSLVALIL